MRELLDSLLSYSRVTSHGMQFVETDLNRLLQDVLSDMQLTIDESNATVVTEPLISVEADPSQIRQLIQNLLSNSLKYRHPDRPLDIRVTGKKVDEGTYQITVEDNGIGFDNQYSEQIFEVFKRLHGRAQYAGTGMGLAICRKIVDRHNGSIHSESQENHYTRFIVRLPVKHQQETLYEF